MRMSSVRRFGEELRLAVKGSTASILAISNRIYRDGEQAPLTQADKEHITALNKEYSQNGMRVLAIGYRELGNGDKEFTREEVEKEIVFLGLMAMIDPPKEGVGRPSPTPKTHI